jgi:signal transduction histidine kinase
MFKRIKKRNVSPNSISPIDEIHLHTLRERFSSVALNIWSAMVIPATIASLTRIPIIGFTMQMKIHIGLAVIMLATWLFRRHLILWQRTVVVVGTPMIIGVVALFSAAPAASAWLLSSALIASLVAGKRTAWLMTLLIIIVFIYFIVITITPEIESLTSPVTWASYNQRAWIVGTVSMATLLFVVLALVSSLQKEVMQMTNEIIQTRKIDAVGKLTGGIAHDFNNSLGTIIGNLDRLLEIEDLDKSCKRYASKALTAAEHSSRVTAALLAYTGQKNLSPTNENINQRIQGIVELLSQTLDTDIKIVYELDPLLWPVKVDGMELDNALVHLAQNAKRAMNSCGTLTVSTRNITQLKYAGAHKRNIGTFDCVEICIADTGIGMEPEVRINMFDPFFTTKDKSDGPGLGLSTVFGFVQQSGGEIDVSSDPIIGTKITITLPRTNESNK